MRRSFVLMLALVMVLGGGIGCSRVQKVVVTQDAISEPYESVGAVEVERKVPRIQYRRIFGKVWEWITFGHAENISREAYLQGLLNKKLLSVAKDDHTAEAVIHVKYWPDLTAKKFPQGRIYGKGDMVRYKRFPA